MDYTITLTDTEKKALEFVCVDIDEFLTNFAKERARRAKDEIVAQNIAHCNANSISIAVGEVAQVDQAYSLGVIKTAEQRGKDNESE
tara:strand:+ start:1259 stop:1519 length:261 start_codon:yes stop_codon:yes gene_type:complete